MLENRSFDHMLGYLSLEGGRGDVDGLGAEFANRHDGRTYRVHHLGSTAIADDPEHSSAAVDLQLGGGKMDGFVASFARTLERAGVPDADPGRVMGYYDGARKISPGNTVKATGSETSGGVCPAAASAARPLSQ